MEAFIAPAPPLLKLLAHDLRWRLLSHLAHSDYRVAELVQLVGEPLNLVSYHLRQLRSQHLVGERRSSADERAVYYRLDLEQLHHLYHEAAAQLHPALGAATDPTQRQQWHFNASTPPLLFLCTGNSSRSPMAAALARHLSGGQVLTFSAGSHPAAQINPRAIQALAHLGIELPATAPKNLDLYREQSFDRVITLCDKVREVCPPFPGHPTPIHWSFADPAKVEGSEAERTQAFDETATQLAKRIRLLLTELELERAAAYNN